MIPADLLNQLRAKDPELYARFADEDLLEYECSCGYLRTFDASDLIDCAQDAWLLYCIMRAVRARGWDFKIEKYHNSIWGMIRIPHECWTDEVFKCKADTEAAALLRAYLAALEAKE